jgi:carboxypeptidase Q
MSSNILPHAPPFVFSKVTLIFLAYPERILSFSTFQYLWDFLKFVRCVHPKCVIFLNPHPKFAIRNYLKCIFVPNIPNSMKFKALAFFCLLTNSFSLYSQDKNERVIRRFYDEELSRSRCYGWLDTLCATAPARISGSANAAKAVEWGKATMDKLGFDRVFLQEVMVPHWVRGAREEAMIYPTKGKKLGVPVAALGGSISTRGKAIKAEVVEVHTFDELTKLGRKAVEGKIIFFNRPMDPTKITTFDAYGGAVNQRGGGARAAGKLGAIGVIVRSMALPQDDNPHTGAMHYVDTIPKIPAAAISTNAANLLSKMLKEDPGLKFSLNMHCETLPDVKSYNVVGEIKGSELPQEIILVGGHLDSWDLAQGAHDDGTGVVQSIDALRLFKVLGIRPKRTIRAVLFMNEENGLKGGIKYAELAKENNEHHIAAIETDAGGFSPRGFSIGRDTHAYLKVLKWRSYFEPYHAAEFEKGGGGADISPLEKQNVTLMELNVDSQRYFDYHHTPIDTFDKVNKRELELGAATLAAMLYLLEENGL